MVTVLIVVLILILSGVLPNLPHSKNRGYYQKPYLIKCRQITVTFSLLALSQNSFATDLPSAGGQFQQIPPSPIIQKEVPKIRIEQRIAPAGPVSDQVKIIVKSLHVIGQTLYSEAELVAITGFKPGGELMLSDLRGMAS